CIVGIALSQLRRLRAMPLPEIAGRLRQEISQRSELLFRRYGEEISDDVLLDELTPAMRKSTLIEAVSGIIARRCALLSRSARPLQPPAFFPGIAHRAAIAAQMEERFPEARLDILRRAERALAGHFDLLGFGEVSFGNPIEWRLEPISGTATGLKHWSCV